MTEGPLRGLPGGLGDDWGRALLDAGFDVASVKDSARPARSLGFSAAGLATIDRQHVRYSGEVMARFAERLRAWRGDHGLNQREAAEHIGVSWRTYQGWEQGRNAPSAAGLAGLERAKAPLPIPTRRHHEDFEVRMLAEADRVRQSLRLIREEQAELHRLLEETRATIRLLEIRLRSGT